MNLSNYIFTVIISILVPGVLYNWRQLQQRLDVMQEKINSKISEDRVRAILDDNVDPIKDTLKSINEKLDNLILHLLKDV
jgi:hypothetical protein